MSTPYYSDDFVTLYHGDCREILPGISGVSCVVTSPPYNTLGTRIPANPTGMHGGDKWAAKVVECGYADDMSEGDYVEWQITVADALASACVPGASFFYNHKIRYRDKAPVHPIDIVRRFESWETRQEIVWDRGGGMALNARMFCPSDERIYWMVKAGASHKWDQRSAGQMSVWRMSPESGIDGHPCPYPIKLPTKCIAATTDPGDLVLDPFVGSGTTARASMDLGRRCVGIDENEAYLEIAAKRLAQGVLDFGAVS